jgi:hypothetical protein
MILLNHQQDSFLSRSTRFRSYNYTYNVVIWPSNPQIYFIMIILRKWLPRVVCSIMDIFNTRSIDNFLPSDWRALDTSNYQTKFSHCSMVLCTTIKTHSGILSGKYLEMIIIRNTIKVMTQCIDEHRQGIEKYGSY